MGDLYRSETETSLNIKIRETKFKYIRGNVVKHKNCSLKKSVKLGAHFQQVLHESTILVNLALLHFIRHNTILHIDIPHESAILV